MPNPATVMQVPVPVESIENRIFLIRGQKVILDADLSELYQVPTKVFNQAVKRNLGRFPEDFMFQLTKMNLKDWYCDQIGGRHMLRFYRAWRQCFPQCSRVNGCTDEHTYHSCFVKIESHNPQGIAQKL
jgi:hypothetical protein